MISYQVYKLIHLLGIFCVIASLAGLAFYTANGGLKSNNKLRKQSGIFHGVGLLLILVAGFGMLARLGITQFPWPGWVFAKFGVWIIFGGLYAAVMKNPTIAKVMWLIIPFLGLLSAYIAVMKPF
ncbi:hypothetical protein [Leptospira sp. GIMC2001]|uniref:hypothetical protein n=1 Tax=Leptospira sp. GIMC2001 TaxID=1513297 RepID=UPI00234959BD|nr:hypothetical protein [Leptospira sp. GIMC2001]WCL49190.1 hypothetical protein O4O04_18140 [Leptospira sp. GIMC2001]